MKEDFLELARRGFEEQRNGEAAVSQEANFIEPPKGKAGLVWFERISGRDLLDAECPLDWLIDDVLVAGQPTMIGALKKTLKTTLSIEMAISLASGEPFLGKFRVTQPVRVAVMSGESGKHTIQETLGRICQAKNWFPGSEGDNLRFCFRVPRLGDVLHLDALRRFIVEDGLKALVIDPTYLALPAGDHAGNLFAQGALLLALTELGQETGCTIILVHHLRKNLAKPFDPPELEDLAWSGFAEWARQWLLIGRRVKYNPDRPGEHRLWMTIGGSAGHSSLWGINVQEGRVRDEGGRIWSAILIPASEARDLDGAGEQQQDTVRKAAKDGAVANGRRAKVLAAFARYPEGETENALASAAGMNKTIFGGVLTALLADSVVCPCKVVKSAKTYDGYRLRSDSLFQDAK